MPYVSLERKTFQVQQRWSLLAPGITDPDSDNYYSNVALPANLRSMLWSANSATLNARKSVIHPDGYRAGYATLISGDSTPPLPLTQTHKYKVPVKTPGFAKRVRSGEIIMNPYHVGEVSVYAYPGNVVTSETIETDRAFSLGAGVVPNGCVRRGSKGRIFVTDGKDHYFSSSGGIFYATFYTMRRSFYNPIIPLSAESVVDKLLSDEAIDTALVTGVVSDANSQSLDLLTQLAELPEAIQMFTNISSRVIKLCRDFRSGNIDLLSRYRRNRRDLMERFDSTVRTIRKREVRERVRERLIQKATRQNNRELQKLVTDFTTALSKLWLTFRYGIMPLVYAAEDIAGLQGDALASFNTERGKVTHSKTLWPIPGWSLDASLSTTHKCVDKRKYTSDTLSGRGISSVLSMDLPTTIWELIPLSFVVDWFINIGDYVSALAGVDLNLQELMSYSWLHEGSFTYSQPAYGRKTVYNVKTYHRAIINPDDYIGLCLNIDLNPKRLADSMALLWRPSRLALTNFLKKRN